MKIVINQPYKSMYKKLPSNKMFCKQTKSKSIKENKKIAQKAKVGNRMSRTNNLVILRHKPHKWHLKGQDPRHLMKAACEVGFEA